MKCIADLNVQQSIILRFVLLALNGNSWLPKIEVSLSLSRPLAFSRVRLGLKPGHTFLQGATANKQRARELISSSIPQNRDDGSTGLGLEVVPMLRESRAIALRSCGSRVHATSSAKLCRRCRMHGRIFSAFGNRKSASLCDISVEENEVGIPSFHRSQPDALMTSAAAPPSSSRF